MQHVSMALRAETEALRAETEASAERRGRLASLEATLVQREDELRAAGVHLTPAAPELLQHGCGSVWHGTLCRCTRPTSTTRCA